MYLTSKETVVAILDFCYDNDKRNYFGVNNYTKERNLCLMFKGIFFSREWHLEI